jgi:hypothetical protein
MSAPTETPYPADVQLTFRKLHREISNLKKKYGIAHDKLVIAEARSHDLKLRAKSAQNGLSVLEQDAHRFRWLKKVGSEAAVALLKPWETDVWDHVVDKARGHIR